MGEALQERELLSDSGVDSLARRMHENAHRALVGRLPVYERGQPTSNQSGADNNTTRGGYGIRGEEASRSLAPTQEPSLLLRGVLPRDDPKPASGPHFFRWPQ